MKIQSMLLLFFLLAFVQIVKADQIPDFSFTDIDDKIYTVSALKGKPLVINIGSHW